MTVLILRCKNIKKRTAMGMGFEGGDRGRFMILWELNSRKELLFTMCYPQTP